jgi:hypothetical protein
MSDAGDDSGGSGEEQAPAEKIAEHLVRDHPERFGRDTPVLVRDIQNIIEHATRQHVVLHGRLAGSKFYYRNGRSVMIRPSGQGTMVSDPGGKTFRNWVNLEP